MFQLKNLTPLGIKFINVISYILYDQFTTDLPAGSVNGTQAEPTGGVRTVMDTNSKLSVSGGVANFSTGGVNYGNPGIWYPVTTRTSGKLLIGNFNVANSSSQQFLGFDDNTSGLPGQNALYLISGLIFLNAGDPQLGSYLYSTIYQLGVLLRSSGAYYYIKGGTQYANWTLLYMTTTLNASTVYPCVLGFSTCSFTADDIRIPASTWLPTPLAYSTFSVDGATSTEAGTSDNVAAYNAPALAITSRAGTFAVASGKGSFTALSGGIGIMTIPTTSTIDVLHEVVGVRSTGDVGVVVRYVDANNYVRAIHNGTNIQLVKVVAGTPTTLINTTATYSASAVLRVICYGTKFRVYYNNAFIGSEQTISDTALQAGVVGLYSSDTGNTFDGLTTFARGTSNEYSALDGF